MRGFGIICNPRFGRLRGELWCPVGSAIQYQAIGVVAQLVERCRRKQLVSREGLIPFGEVDCW